ncbi:MAG: hypothetical protein IIA03_04940 [Proteobacteria bacterium]|nr:hypothetical protein [Pseudomonadota bacterium]
MIRLDAQGFFEGGASEIAIAAALVRQAKAGRLNRAIEIDPPAYRVSAGDSGIPGLCIVGPMVDEAASRWQSESVDR